MPADDATGTPIYDTIGRGYTATREADPRIAAAIHAALGDVRTVVNLGAGAGAYEPPHARVIAVEPSAAMIRQRPPGAAAVVQAAAESLPLPDASVDAALAVLTVHHWADVARGLAEARRVARRRVVVLTWDPAARDAFWLTAEYLPEIVQLDTARFPAIGALRSHFARSMVRPLRIPHDCRDGFLGAFWRRPAAYLDPRVRAGMSGFAQLAPGAADRGLARLAEDLRSGRWQARHGTLCRRAAVDLGYRLVIGFVPRRPPRACRGGAKGLP